MINLYNVAKKVILINPFSTSYKNVPYTALFYHTMTLKGSGTVCMLIMSYARTSKLKYVLMGFIQIGTRWTYQMPSSFHVRPIFCNTTMGWTK